jgi:acetyl-CoA synthetase
LRPERGDGSWPGSKIVITADEGLRGGKRVPLKADVDAALERPGAGMVETVVVISHTHADIPIIAGRDVLYREAKCGVSADCPCEPMNAEDPLFILYTSGSTGKPKGVLHTTGGYLFRAAWTHDRPPHPRTHPLADWTMDVRRTLQARVIRPRA